jgi:hypothetical protein
VEESREALRRGIPSGTSGVEGEYEARSVGEVSYLLALAAAPFVFSRIVPLTVSQWSVSAPPL